MGVFVDWNGPYDDLYGDENTAWRYADPTRRFLEETDKSPTVEDGEQPWEHHSYGDDPG